MGNNSLRSSDDNVEEYQRPQVIGNFQGPEGRLIVMRVDVTADPRSPDQGELGRFKINGAAYAVRRDQRADDRASADLARSLTGRELEVAALVAAGRGNKQIAAKLHISEHTVSSYLNRIYSKLGMHNRSAVAARYAAWASNLPVV
jgi:DNA-binding CsgD family transcriptional regulator